MPRFQLISEYLPTGDQPEAIAQLTEGVVEGRPHQVLLGVTGSGKTFTIANVIANVQKPTLVIAHNKTLAAQLFNEFRTFFPHNAAHYFVSYYDYYQPEAYLPQSDTYIEKDASINDEIDRMRHAATTALLERNDVIIVASVSCIYGLGSPEAYQGMLLHLEAGQEMSRDRILRKLVEIHYERSQMDLRRGTFRAQGDVIEVFPASEEDRVIRIELFGDTVDTLTAVDSLTGESLAELPKVPIYPGSHYVTPRDQLERAVRTILDELKERVRTFEDQGRMVEARRVEQRTRFDMEMLLEVGYCHGIENYSRHLTGRAPGEPPPTLMDYFPRDSLIVVDESHATIPQIGGMYNGDRSRKLTLVEYGFRLPSALDNRPLNFQEYEANASQVIYVSATPATYELNKAGGLVVEQVVRPTGLLDPKVAVRPVKGQVDDLLHEVRVRAARDERVLVTTLTKRMAEDLTDYYEGLGVRVRYLHADIDTLDRVEIIRALRLGEFDVLIGVNLLREGLDIPEVSLVAILDADKEGFLRSERSLIQTSGRAARNVSGEVIFYADTITASMAAAMRETERRRAVQEAYNRKHGITPETVKKQIHEVMRSVSEADYYTVPVAETMEPLAAEPGAPYVAGPEVAAAVEALERDMREAARKLEFERAAELRDRIRALKAQEITVGVKV